MKSIRVLALLSAYIGSGSQVFAISVVLSKTFDDPTASQDDFFGSSVGLSGNKALISAHGHTSGGSNVGQAHLFDAETGSIIHNTIDPPSTEWAFAIQVALNENYIVVSSRGSIVYLYDTNTGSFERSISDPVVSSGVDLFGSSLAVDGNYVLVGDVRDYTDGSEVGLVHLFDALTGDVIQTFHEPNLTGRSTNFGASVAIEGNHVLIGASLGGTSRSGRAYLFDAITGGLLQTFDNPNNTSSTNDWDRFGGSVDLNSGNVLIGSYGNNSNGQDVGQAYLFDAESGSLLHTFDDPTATTGDYFGASVAIDGNFAVIGAIWDDTFGRNAGQAHLFDVTSGSLLHTFVDPTPIGSLFGSSVDIEGRNVLIGNAGDRSVSRFNSIGQAYLYTIVPEPSSVVLILILLITVPLRRESRSTRICTACNSF